MKNKRRRTFYPSNHLHIDMLKLSLWACWCQQPQFQKKFTHCVKCKLKQNPFANTLLQHWFYGLFQHPCISPHSDILYTVPVSTCLKCVTSIWQAMLSATTHFLLSKVRPDWATSTLMVCLHRRCFNSACQSCFCQNRSSSTGRGLQLESRSQRMAEGKSRLTSTSGSRGHIWKETEVNISARLRLPVIKCLNSHTQSPPPARNVFLFSSLQFNVWDLLCRMRYVQSLKLLYKAVFTFITEGVKFCLWLTEKESKNSQKIGEEAESVLSLGSFKRWHETKSADHVL